MSRVKKVKVDKWKGYKDEILKLRDEGHRIKGTPAKEGIVEIMDRKGLKTTPWKIEDLFRQHGKRKNLSASEWCQVLQLYDYWKDKGRQYNFLMNGVQIQESVLRRKRTLHYKTPVHLTQSQALEMQIEPPGADEPAIESLDGPEDTVAASLNVTRQEYSETPQATNLSHNNEAQNMEIDPLVAGSKPQEERNPMTFDEGSEDTFTESGMDLILSPSMQQLTWDPINASDTISRNLNISQPFPLSEENSSASPFNQREENMSHADSWSLTSMRSPPTGTLVENAPEFSYDDIPNSFFASSPLPSLEFDGLGGENQLTVPLNFPNSPFTKAFQPSPMIYNHSQIGQSSILREQSEVTSILPPKGLSLSTNEKLVQILNTKLASLLLPDSLFTLYLETTSQLQMFTNSLHKLAIYVIENNFSGCSGVPAGTILQFLQQEPQLRPILKAYLKQSPRSISKNLAEKLMIGAIENCDAQTVSELLSLGLLNVNAIKCQVGHKENGFHYILGMYTAVQRSAMLRNFEITRMLIRAGAEVNGVGSYGRGALECAIGWKVKGNRGSPSPFGNPVEMKLVDIIVDAGASISRDTLSYALSWRDDDLSTKILQKLLPSGHTALFHHGYGIIPLEVKQIIQYLDGGLATKLVEQIFQACFDIGCGKCPKASQNQSMIKQWILAAAERGLTDLFKFLVHHITELDDLLISTVCIGRNELVEFLLSMGADVHARSKHSSSYMYHRTPLGEAIRVGNTRLVTLLESRGALECTIRKDEIIAALEGVAEAGNFPYLQKILQVVPRANGRNHLGSAFSIAVAKGHEQFSMFLIDIGADINHWDHRCHDDGPDTAKVSPLANAIKQRKKDLAWAILERDDYIYERSDALEEAIRWGEPTLIADLVAACSSCCSDRANPMVAAIKSGNSKALNLLLAADGSWLFKSHGAESPLSVAIGNGDIAMCQYLVDLGVDPADDIAFNNVLKNDTYLNSLLAMFCTKYPKGKKGFGVSELKEAVIRGDVNLLAKLLNANFDFNTFPDKKSYCGENALGLAIKHKNKNRVELVKKLLDAGADVNGIVSEKFQAPDERLTALLQSIATEDKNLVQFMIEEGAEIDRPARLGIKRTPLQSACEIGNFEIVELLLSLGAKPNEEPAFNGGGTSLQLCAIGGHCEIAYKLLQAGADIYGKPSQVNGRSALEGAAELGRLHMLKLLWDAAANIRGFEWKECNSAMKLAEENGHMGCSDLLNELYNQIPRHIGYD